MESVLKGITAQVSPPGGDLEGAYFLKKHLRK
jgi:hypothetical protein